ncbi:MAG: sarcosine oxidase subunit gamma [Brucellaceae bacterium]|jgi:sarcosine oxidase subunit gamma|nr:sarcosine oxidase subunit gamma [Brucellaceae bacterium]
MSKSEAIAQRITVLGNSRAGNGSVQITPAEPAERISLRARTNDLADLSKALGVTLPQKPKHTANKGKRSALWLGPDEWLVIDTGGKSPFADLQGIETLHAATDVSHRNIGILISGEGAEATINAGCPQDLSLSVFPVGAATRTIFGKAEIVLWRLSETEFRLECWRSFAPYVFGLLSEGALDAAV